MKARYKLDVPRSSEGSLSLDQRTKVSHEIRLIYVIISRPITEVVAIDIISSCNYRINLIRGIIERIY